MANEMVLVPKTKWEKVQKEAQGPKKEEGEENNVKETDIFTEKGAKEAILQETRGAEKVAKEGDDSYDLLLARLTED